jgi:catechol 2,3-dioxygenase-like lactoylglutathione lyase family enzyme
VRVTEDRFPTKGVELTHILVVADLGRARSFYRDVLEATVIREYGGTSYVLGFGALGSYWSQKGDQWRKSPTWPSFRPTISALATPLQSGSLIAGLRTRY